MNMCMGTSFVALRDNQAVVVTGPALDDVFTDEACEICNAAEEHVFLHHGADLAITPPAYSNQTRYEITAMQGCAIDTRIVFQALADVRAIYRSRGSY